MSIPAVELRQVSKVFASGLRAVDSVSLTIPAHHTVALLGASGAGKTTVLRLINRLEEASAGEVLVRGRDVRKQPLEQLRRSIGYVIQEGGLFPHLNVAANVGTVPGLLRWPRTRIRQRVAEVLSLVGLPEAEYGRRMPAQLSGGQRQRVGVARALAADPDLLLMDEPFGALDPGTRATLQDEFGRLQSSLHKTVILVTHDVAEAGKLADRIILLDQGRVIQEGNLADLLLRPADQRVRSFLGGQARDLTLTALRLRHILDGIPTLPSPRQQDGTMAHARLSPELPLGEVLVALADAADEMIVNVDDRDGQVGSAYSAGVIRRHIIHDLRACSQ